MTEWRTMSNMPNFQEAMDKAQGYVGRPIKEYTPPPKHEEFLVARVSQDARVVGIDHPKEAPWEDVRAAHIALRDRLNERLEQADLCPHKPSPAPQQPQSEAQADKGEDEPDANCERCQGNGEIVTDWERYLHPHDGDAGDEAVAECSDCDGTGSVSQPAQVDAEPLGSIYWQGCNKLIAWRNGEIPPAGTKLYAHPPAQSQSEKMLREALELCREVLPRFVHSVSDEDKHVAGRTALKAVLAALTPKGQAE